MPEEKPILLIEYENRLILKILVMNRFMREIWQFIQYRGIFPFNTIWMVYIVNNSALVRLTFLHLNTLSLQQVSQPADFILQLSDQLGVRIFINNSLAHDLLGPEKKCQKKEVMF